MNIELYKKMEKSDGSITFEPFDIDNVTIYGRSIKEIGQILDGLEVERMAEIKMTMENLSYLFKKINDEQNKMIQMQIKKYFSKGSDF